MSVKDFWSMATLNDFVNTQGVRLVDTAIEDIELLKRNEPEEVELRQMLRNSGFTPVDGRPNEFEIK
jgi:hypothetical protein